MREKPTLNDLKLVINKWGGKNIPTVYLEGESWYEVLQILANKVYESLEWIDDYFDTDLESIVEQILNKWNEDGRFTSILKDIVHEWSKETKQAIKDLETRTDTKLDELSNLIANDINEELRKIDNQIDEYKVLVNTQLEQVENQIDDINIELNTKQPKSDLWVNAEWLGLEPNIDRNQSTIMQAIIDELPPMATLYIQSGEYTFGNIEITKPISIETGENVTIYNETGYVFSAKGNMEPTYTLLSKDAIKDSNQVSLSGAKHGLQSGDYIQIREERKRYTDNLITINVESHQIKEVHDNSIILHDMLGESKTVAQQARVYKINMLENIRIGNIKVVGLETTEVNTGGISFNYVANSAIDKISSKNYSMSSVSFINCYNVKLGRGEFRQSVDRFTGGRGYGLLAMNSNHVHVDSLIGHTTRHTLDLSSTYNVVIGSIHDQYNDTTPIILAHNTYGGNIFINSIKLENCKDGISVLAQGIGTSDNFVTRNIRINSINVTSTLLEKGGVVINFPYRTEGCSIGSLSIVNSGSENGNTSGIGITLGSGLTIENMYIKNLRNALYFRDQVSESVNTKPLIINSIVAENCSYVGTTAGVGADLIIREGELINTTNFVYIAKGKLKTFNVNLKDIVGSTALSYPVWEYVGDDYFNLSIKRPTFAYFVSSSLTEIPASAMFTHNRNGIVPLTGGNFSLTNGIENLGTVKGMSVKLVNTLTNKSIPLTNDITIPPRGSQECVWNGKEWIYVV